MKLNLKKAITLFAVFGLGFSTFAQEADDGFLVPLDEDLANAVSTSSESSASSSSNSKLKMGTWTEVTSKNGFLIRDLANGDKKGYEFDNSHFLSNMNWWFWGEIGNGMMLDAEIAVWDFDKTLYQANTYGANVPDVTWADGFQDLSSMLFAPISEANSTAIGTFNKLAINLTSPFVNLKIGYGNLKGGGMADFEGIYKVIDRWDDVGKGFTEISLGKSLQEFGNFKINALAGFSRTKEVSSQPFGMYDLIDLKYSDKVETAFTFASTTTEEKLFYYNENNTNAISTYLAVTPIEKLKIECHYLGSFGTDLDLGSETSAFGFRAGWKSDSWSASAMQSFSGNEVNSVWGSDGEKHDRIKKGKTSTQIDLCKSFKSEILPFSLGLDQGIEITDDDYLVQESINEKLSLRTQPYADFDFSNLLGQNLNLGFYSVLEFNKIAESVNADNPFLSRLDEMGFEIVSSDLPFVKKVVFDYALSRTYNLNDSKDGYDDEYFYNSFMLNADLNERVNVHLGALFNSKEDSDDSFIPFGIATGFKIANMPLPGKPFFWMHFSYGMNPYEDNNYSLYRADDSSNKIIHRNYLLNTLDTKNESQISLGLIWNL